MRSSLLDILLDGPFELRVRPEPIAGDLRPAWGIALIVFMLGHSRARSASLQKLHFLAHSVRTAKSRLEAERVFSGQLRPSDFLVRVEPWLNRALAFARADDLVELKKGKTAKLTDRGVEALARLNATEDILVEERAFLAAIRSRATEGAINKVMRMEPTL
jgi:hypothetical protein